jgi:DNA primase
VIGFGGRVLGAGEPKYLNSPETPLFEKGRELYGLSHARNAIRAKGRVLVVEGYMDVVALAQHGVENAVATLGTATSAIHIQKLFRQTDEIVFCFDGDAAGRRAAWHALEVALPLLTDTKVARFLFLPAEHDPDSFVREKGAAAFEGVLDAALPLSEYLLSELKARVDLGTAEGRAKLLASAGPLLKRLEAPMLKLQLRKSLQQAAQLSQQDLPRAPRSERPFFAGSRAGPTRVERSMPSLERKMLRCLLMRPELARMVPTELVEMRNPEAEALLAFLEVQATFDSTPSVGHLLDVLKPSKHAALYQQLIHEGLEIGMSDEDAETDVREALSKLEVQRLERQIEAVSKERNVDPERLRALHDRHAALRKSAA